MAGPNQKIEVDFIDKSIALRMSNTVTGVTGNWEYHPVCNVVSITGQLFPNFANINPATNQRAHRYPHDDMARIIIEMNGVHQLDIDFDLNDVTNQAGWTVDAAGVEQAKADINAWIAQCGSGSGGVDLSDIKDCLDILIDQTDDLEQLAQDSLTELQAINLNTDGIEALLTAGNLDTTAILAELQGQTTIMNTHTTSLSNILAAITLADTNNTDALGDILTELQSMLTELQSIEANTAPLEAAINDVETAVTNAGSNTVTELQAIQTQLSTVITELMAVNITLSSINGQFGGTTTITRVNISANPAFVIAPATYFAVQLIVIAGTVSDGVIPHPVGAWGEDPQLNKTHPGATLDATGATAYVKLMF